MQLDNTCIWHFTVAALDLDSARRLLSGDRGSAEEWEMVVASYLLTQFFFQTIKPELYQSHGKIGNKCI